MILFCSEFFFLKNENIDIDIIIAKIDFKILFFIILQPTFEVLCSWEINQLTARNLR